MRGWFLGYRHDSGDRYSSSHEVVLLDVRDLTEWRSPPSPLILQERVNHHGDLAWIREGVRHGHAVERLFLRRDGAVEQIAVAGDLSHLHLSDGILSWRAGHIRHRRPLA